MHPFDLNFLPLLFQIVGSLQFFMIRFLYCHRFCCNRTGVFVITLDYVMWIVFIAAVITKRIVV